MSTIKSKPAFKIIKSQHETGLNYTHKLYLDGKLLSDKLYVWETGDIYIDDFPEFNISKIAKMESEDFPKGFRFSFHSGKPLEKVFDMFTIERKQNTFRISMYAGMDLESTEGLIWHPLRFIKVAYELGTAKGYEVSTAYEPLLHIYMNIKIEKILGLVFNKAFSQLHELMEETNKELWKRGMSDN